MASTYTNNLRLEQQGTGDNDNTWGIRLNTTLSLIDDAISGMTTVNTTGGTTVLTTNNAAADEARRAILKITGALTSNVTITVPTKSKRYVVWNATTGAFTVTVNASGSGVAVSQGKVCDVFCDGTNVRAVSAEVDPATPALIKDKTLGTNLAAGGFLITGLGNAVSAGDAVNLATAQAILSGGGTPGNIPITSLGVGTATSRQFIAVNEAGTAIIGVTGGVPDFLLQQQGVI